MARITWINSAQAAAILSEKAGRDISLDYTRLLGRKGKLRTKVDEEKSTVLFSQEDCEAYKVARRTDRRVELRVRDRRSGKPGGRPRKQAVQSDGDDQAHRALLADIALDLRLEGQQESNKE